MPQVKYTLSDGSTREVDVPAGESVMVGATINDIRGIDADCGGALACATCHVYVDPAWADKVGEKSDMEETMLDFAQELQPTSRLSCQIKVSPELDGLVVKMPKSQH